MNIKVLLQAYKHLHDAEMKQKALDKMSAAPINYGIIRDLMNSAYNGVTITVTFQDGTKLDIKRDDQLDRLQKKYQEAF
jgi:hypothetical protein